MANTAVVVPFSETSGGIVFPGSITIPATAAYIWSTRSQLKSPADGIITLLNNAGTDFTRLQFGGTTASFPSLKRSSTTLAVRLADDSADAPISASNVTLSGDLAAVNAALSGTVTVSNAAPTINSTAATTYLQTWQNNGTAEVALDKGGQFVPNVINTTTYYYSNDWDFLNAATGLVQNGNQVIGATNSVSAPLMANSTQGVGYVNTSSTTVGGYVTGPTAYNLIKSSTILYQWRILFYLPTASSSANRYTAYIGGFVGTGTANNANGGPFAGPYISYTDNGNSGNWVMGSGVNNTRTTANSSTAPANAAWNTLQINLNNGVYTYLVNGVNIGTVTDANITSSPANGQAASWGGIMILPDGTNFTTNRVVMIDRSDFWVTGLTR